MPESLTDDESPLTDDERMALKTAAFGAVYLVSRSDPGVISMIRESFAASNAIAGAPGLVGEALAGGPAPILPKGSAAGVAGGVAESLRSAMRILREKAPAEVDNFRAAVLVAADEVAKASRGVHPEETASIDRIRDALA